MILELTGVLRDATKPAGTLEQQVPERAPLVWPRGEDGTLRLTVRKQDGTVANLGGGTIVFAVRKYPTDAAPVVSRQGTLVDAVAGRADIPLVQADTLNLKEEVRYRYDVQYIDGTGKRWQVIPESNFEIAPIIALPGEAVSVPASQVPLAQGPSWLAFSDVAQKVTDGTTAEQVKLEWAWNFDLATANLANLLADLTALALVSGGQGTVRVRVGGTAGQPDGTVLLATGPIT